MAQLTGYSRSWIYELVWGYNGSQFYIGTSWGLHETTVGWIVNKVEDLLLKCDKFPLPSKCQFRGVLMIYPIFKTSAEQTPWEVLTIVQSRLQPAYRTAKASMPSISWKLRTFRCEIDH